MAPINKYSPDLILRSLEQNYHLTQLEIKPSSSGLDNSVYLVTPNDSKTPKYVLKIIETKPDEQILSSVEISSLSIC